MPPDLSGLFFSPTGNNFPHFDIDIERLKCPVGTQSFHPY
jgi:hypothetical protein